ncbi:hypothetical protein [Streptomyces sp. NPDC005969]|uniref:hypothetical protein n=1 Tax=Streptomyces sp. NPDC005969 TaxID=3156722 RepID=UPI003410F73C
MNGKIALEEHFNLPEFSNELPQYVNPETMREVSRRLLEMSTERLGEMDAAGIDYSLLSLTAPGVQGETDPRRAVTRAMQVNDELAEIVAVNPTQHRARPQRHAGQSKVHPVRRDDPPGPCVQGDRVFGPHHDRPVRVEFRLVPPARLWGLKNHRCWSAPASRVVGGDL